MSCPKCQSIEAVPSVELSDYATCVRCGNRYPRALCSEELQGRLDRAKPRFKLEGYREGAYCRWDGMDPRLMGSDMFRNRTGEEEEKKDE